MNVIALIAVPFKERRRGGGNNTCSIQILTPAEPWKRKVFNGLAQVIVQSTGKSGIITLKVASLGLIPTVLEILAGE